MIKKGNILTDSFDTYKVIDVQDDYVVALLQSDINGPVDQDEDNIGEFIMRSDIAE